MSATFWDASRSPLPAMPSADPDPTDGFSFRPAADQAAAVEAVRAAFAARLEADPDADPPNWPVLFDGKRLPHGVCAEAWDLVRFPGGRAVPSGTALERFAWGVAAALAAREEHHRRWLRPEPGWEPWPAHRPARWDAAMKRAGLVAPLVLEREAAAPPEAPVKG